MLLYDVFYGDSDSFDRGLAKLPSGAMTAYAQNTNGDGHRLFKVGPRWKRWVDLTERQEGIIRSRFPALFEEAAGE